MQKKRDADGVERTIPCPHKASPRSSVLELDLNNDRVRSCTCL